MPISNPSLPSVPGGLHIDELTLDGGELLITARTTAAQGSCPLCKRPSARVHSTYWRTLRDLPWQDRAVTWRVKVRRFRCSHCPGRIFAERVPGLGRVKARRSDRLAEAQTDMGMVLGGEAGARLSRRLASGMLVNLGIGIPALVANFVPAGIHVFFQSENGLIGTGPVPEPGMALRWLKDAGGRPVTALPGASTFDSAMSFGLIRGGHLDLTVLGGLQVDQHGRLANWMVPGKMVPGMGGAMDLVAGAKRVIVAMQHTAKGRPKIVWECSLPLTSDRPVDLVVTELAVIGFPDGRATVLETAEGVTVEQVLANTEAELAIGPELARTNMASTPEHVPVPSKGEGG